MTSWRQHRPIFEPLADVIAEFKDLLLFLTRKVGVHTTVREAVTPFLLAAQLASVGLDEDRSRLYCDLIFHSLSEAARRALQSVNSIKYQYQSEFAKRYVAQGVVEGREKGEQSGRVAMLSRQLTKRFGVLAPDVETRLARASIEQLDEVAERLLTASTLQESIGSLSLSAPE